MEVRTREAGGVKENQWLRGTEWKGQAKGRPREAKGGQGRPKKAEGIVRAHFSSLAHSLACHFEGISVSCVSIHPTCSVFVMFILRFVVWIIHVDVHKTTFSQSASDLS